MASLREFQVIGHKGEGSEEIGLTAADQDMIALFNARQQRLHSIMYSVGSLKVAVGTEDAPAPVATLEFRRPSNTETPEAVKAQNKKMMEKIRRMTEMQAAFIKRINDAVKPTRPFTLDDNTTAQLFLEMAAAGGRDIGRTFFVDGKAIGQYDDGGKVRQGEFADVDLAAQASGDVFAEVVEVALVQPIQRNDLAHGGRGRDGLVRLQVDTRGLAVDLHHPRDGIDLLELHVVVHGVQLDAEVSL
jgi:hypothetical protein